VTESDHPVIWAKDKQQGQYPWDELSLGMLAWLSKPWIHENYVSQATNA
jgi:hypothetical protein